MARSVAEYYSSNYTKCTVDHSFLASWEGLVYPLRAVQSISLPLSILTFYCILKKSPDVMSSVKRPLFSSHLWCSLMNLLICSLSAPYVFFPTQAGFSIGILQVLGVHVVVQLCIAVVVVSCSVISLVRLYELRSSFIRENVFRLERTCSIVLFYSIDFIVCLLVCVLFLLNPTDNQEEAKLRTLQKLPCPTEEFFTHPTYVVISDESIGRWLIRYLAFTTVLFVSQLTLFAACCVYHLFYSPSIKTSPQTRRLQRRFFIGLCLQSGVPYIFMGGGTGLLYVTYALNMTDQKINNLVVILYSIHGAAESIVVILVHQNYRDFVRKWFFGERAPSKFVQVGSTVSQQPKSPSFVQ